MAGTFIVDDRAQKALIRHYAPDKLARIFQASARSGAKAVESVLRPAAPVGDSVRPSQFYRRQGLSHGAFAATVKARRIRKRGANRTTIGFVIGPGGRNAFTRHWIAGGTRAHRIGRIQHPGQQANPWVERAAGRATSLGNRASEVVILRHVAKIPGV
jgi:hypothetical protein